MAPAPTTKRGELRIYFGVAPGVGKTYAMLGEGWRRSQRGTDVVVAYYEDHDRPQTAAQLHDLPIIPRRVVSHREQSFSEMDVDAVLARKPEVALVDELAHTNATGMRNAKRWQDVEELLVAGIDVITTVNVQHIESLNDVVERVTGVRQLETIPDAVLRGADQTELVDMSPEALRRRMAHGNIYPASKVDAALANYFRPGNLNALRELALLWVADQVDEKLQEYRERHGIEDTWDTRETIVVALTTSPGEEQVIRRAARSAKRNRAQLIGVHVRTDDGLVARNEAHLHRYVALLKEFGGTYREVVGSKVAATLVNAARRENATQLFLGESDRGRLSEIVHGSTVAAVVRAAGAGLDVYVISTKQERTGRDREVPTLRWLKLSPLSLRRRVIAWVLVCAGLPLMTVSLIPHRDAIELQNALLAYLTFAVVVGAIGGVWPAVFGTALAFFLLDWLFTPPYHRFTIANSHDAVALAAFVLIAGIVSTLVDVAARRARDARVARFEAQGLARMATSMLNEADPLPGILGDLVTTFRLDGAALLVPSASGWTPETTAGLVPPVSPVDGNGVVTISLSPRAQLVVSGSSLSPEDENTLRSFGGQLKVAIETKRLQHEAAEAHALAKSNELRAALLSAVSHDLRTPLSTIKAAATSLLSENMSWEPGAEHRTLVTIDEEADRLNVMVADLLDLSRIRAGALVVQSRPVSVEEVVASLLDALPGNSGRLQLQIADELPDLMADPTLLQRVLVNVAENAFKYSSGAVQLAVTSVPDGIQFRVVDSGAGIPEADRDTVFRPFQRLGDVPDGQGVGLGLALARGFTEAMGGGVRIEDTPGGGTTIVVQVPTA